MLESVLDLRRDAVARPDFPLIKPDPHAIRLQPVRDVTDDVFVLRAVAEEDVVFEAGCVGHAVAAKTQRDTRKDSSFRSAV